MSLSHLVTKASRRRQEGVGAVREAGRAKMSGRVITDGRAGGVAFSWRILSKLRTTIVVACRVSLWLSNVLAPDVCRRCTHSPVNVDPQEGRFAKRLPRVGYPFPAFFLPCPFTSSSFVVVFFTFFLFSFDLPSLFFRPSLPILPE